MSDPSTGSHAQDAYERNAAERRAPCQRNGRFWSLPYEERKARAGEPGGVDGSVSWDEHVRAWLVYAKRFGTGQSAERMAQRGGFCFSELTQFLGYEPKTWRPR